MIRVSIINGIIFTFTYICSEWFSSVRNVRVVRLSIVLNEVINERIRARCIVWRVGKCQDILIVAYGESFNFAVLRISQFFSQDFQKMSPARFITVKSEP